jgi:hypothetical protein
MLPRRVLNNRTKLKKKLFCHIWDWSFYSNTVLLNEHCHEKHDILENIDIFIDAHRGRGTGGTSCTPSKDFKKLDHTNAVQHKNRGPPTRFSHNPKFPPQKNLKKTVHLWKNCKFKIIWSLNLHITHMLKRGRTRRVSQRVWPIVKNRGRVTRRAIWNNKMNVFNKNRLYSNINYCARANQSDNLL